MLGRNDRKMLGRNDWKGTLEMTGKVGRNDMENIKDRLETVLYVVVVAVLSTARD